MHWDAGRLLPRGEACFRTLAADFGAKFADYASKSLAFEVIELLGWRSVRDYTDDLNSLA